MTSITGFTLHNLLCDAFLRAVVMLPVIPMSASRAFPRKLAECHEMLAQFTAELAALKQSVADQLRIVAESQQKHAEEQQKNAGLQESIEGVRKELGELREAHQKALHEIDMYRRWVYGSRRERFTEDPRQKHLFPMGSLVTSEQVPPEPAEAAAPNPEEAKPAEVRKKKRESRKLCLESLPQIHHEVDVDPADKVCTHCGSEKVCIGEEVTKVIELIPARLEVHNYHRRKVACTCGKSGVTTPPAPIVPIAKSVAGASLLASLITSKTGDHLPTFRSEDILVRSGLHIPRSTLCDWMHHAALLLLPLTAYITQRILAQKVLWTDDTQVKFFGNNSRDVKSRAKAVSLPRGRLWVYSPEDDAPYTCYDFTISRHRDGPETVLKGWSGFLHADAYSGYDSLFLGGNSGIVEVGCWAHARRYFEQALESDHKTCSIVLSWIRHLYDIEDRARTLSVDERRELRQAESVPMLKRFADWLRVDEHSRFGSHDLPKGVLPKSLTAKAIRYTGNNWKALNTYTTDGRLSIDNNLSERTVRAIAVGRKNWQFVGSEQAGCRMSILFTIMANAKRHHLEPFAYVHDLLLQMTWLRAEHNLEVLDIEAANRLSAAEFRAYAKSLADKLPEDALKPLLPNNWAQAHPQYVLQHRIEEARRLANRKRDDRKRRRACDPVPGQLADLNQPSEPSPAAAATE